MEQRLKRDPINSTEYSNFLAEYENLGHITKSLPIDIITSPINPTTSRIMLSYMTAIQPHACESSSTRRPAQQTECRWMITCLSVLNFKI